MVAGSDGPGELSEARGKTLVGGDVEAEVIVVSTQVLDEGVACGNYPSGAILFETPHRSQPGFETSVIALDGVVGVTLDVMPGRRN